MAKFKKLPYAKDWIFSDDILIEAADIILDDFKLDFEHDVPYVAGYDVNGDTIYVDKDVYKAIKDEKKDKWLKPLCFHEAIEKSIMLQHPKLEYQFCHQNALRLELELVTAMKINKKEYDEFMDKYIKKIADLKEYTNLPKDLDLKPYEDEKDYTTLKKMRSGNQFKTLRSDKD
jgi:carbonic anhydrase